MTRGRARATRGPLPVRRGVISSNLFHPFQATCPSLDFEGFVVLCFSSVRCKDISILRERERERERVWCVRNIFPPSILPIIAATSETSVSVRSRRKRPRKFPRVARHRHAKKNDSFSYLFALECEDFPPGFPLIPPIG